MYLMHGQGGSERSWHDNDLYAHIQLDNLIGPGNCRPVYHCNLQGNDYANWSGFGNILINDLIPFVEEPLFRLCHPENRALGGLSMGGMQTINFGLPNADKFPLPHAFFTGPRHPGREPNCFRTTGHSPRPT
jgi:homoserine acetyltransferase